MQQGVDFTFESWRETVRPWLVMGHKADGPAWSEIRDSANAESVLGQVNARTVGAPPLRLPPALMNLLRNLACFRHPSRWEFMYRLAWRVLYEKRSLLEDSADADVANAISMDRAVRRDLHKMHAFVRFRDTDSGAGDPHFFSWFEPQHEILPLGAQFFVSRFRNMHWTIATPDGAAIWDTQSLQFVLQHAPVQRPVSDSHEDLWRTYYRSICNVARINPRAMQREMPKHYWQNLPEAQEITMLIRDGAARFAANHNEVDLEKFSSAKSLQQSLAQLPAPEDGIQKCRACDLWRHATQAVEGEGPNTAQIVIVGEQPGDQEDLQGKPFIGPAGKLLDDLLESAALKRCDIYITNAVKHFKWEPRGKRRLHKRPNVGEIRACNVWLQGEINTIKPRVIIALGSSALTALNEPSLTIEAARTKQLFYSSGARIFASYHPSAILRAVGDRASVLRNALIEDLKAVARVLSPDA